GAVLLADTTPRSPNRVLRGLIAGRVIPGGPSLLPMRNRPRTLAGVRRRDATRVDEKGHGADEARRVHRLRDVLVVAGADRLGAILEGRVRGQSGGGNAAAGFA